jgi:uncharacterized protein (TIGR02453 family)
LYYSACLRRSHARRSRFLRALKRNNDREWFRARKAEYEQHVRGPMIELLARLAGDFRTFAPELMADPKVSLFRIYRDTRFSENKSPLKTHVAAYFPPRGFPRPEGAGLYIEIAPQWVWMGGGIYMPTTAELQAIREQVAATHPRLHRIVTAPTFRKVLGQLSGDRLTRVPARLRQEPSGRELPAAQTVSCVPRVRGRVRDQKQLLPGGRTDLHSDDAAGALPQRATRPPRPQRSTWPI